MSMVNVNACSIGLLISADIFESLPGTVPRKTSNNDVVKTRGIARLYMNHNEFVLYLCMYL